MTGLVSSVTLRKFLNKTDQHLEWLDPFGRRKSLAPHRGGFFAMSEQLGELVRAGKIEEVVERHNPPGGFVLPRSTQRPIPTPLGR